MDSQRQSCILGIIGIKATASVLALTLTQNAINNWWILVHNYCILLDNVLNIQYTFRGGGGGGCYRCCFIEQASDINEQNLANGMMILLCICVVDCLRGSNLLLLFSLLTVLVLVVHCMCTSTRTECLHDKAFCQFALKWFTNNHIHSSIDGLTLDNAYSTFHLHSSFICIFGKSTECMATFDIQKTHIRKEHCVITHTHA